jgi:hypothetical protein
MNDNFEPCWARSVDDNVSHHVDTHKSGPGILLIASQGLNRRRHFKTPYLREVFVVAQFSTFSTVSDKADMASG